MIPSPGPTLSIIVPVYNANREATPTRRAGGPAQTNILRRCIESILNQTLEDFELLLCDDGSTDGSGEICDEYAARDCRVRVLHKDNSGVSDTRNYALARAQGTFVQFVDADDWLVPEASSLLVGRALDQKADLVIADYYRVVGEYVSHKGDIETTGVLTREEYAAWMMKNPADFYYGVLWNKLYRLGIIRDHELSMDPSISWCEDFLFNLEYVLYCERIAALGVPIYYYVKTEGSLVERSVSLSSVVRTKLTLIEYYNAFYRLVYDDAQYRRSRPDILRFLVDGASDGNVRRFAPGTRLLGQERVPVYASPALGEDLYARHYYGGKLLLRSMERSARETGLELTDVQALAYIGRAGELRVLARREAADIAGLSLHQLQAACDRLQRRKLLQPAEEKGEMVLRLTPEGKETAALVLRGLAECNDLWESETGEHRAVSERLLTLLEN